MSSPAPACRRALSDATGRWPTRQRASDGIMGDARHQASRSDHNLGNAFDITHDPRSGCTGDVIAAHALLDDRVTYVIWNRRINSRDARGWRNYTGRNPHTSHCHVSIKVSARADNRPWGWAQAGSDPEVDVSAEARTPPAGELPHTTASYPGRLVRQGARGAVVRAIQQQLHRLGWVVGVDGIFGSQTRSVVMQFQRRKGLAVDGVVGRTTWSHLFAAERGVNPT